MSLSYESTTTPLLVYHGDPARGNHFWAYPTSHALPNLLYNTHNVTQLCNNHKYVKIHSNNINIVEFECLGHASGSLKPVRAYHGDPARNNHFWVYPQHYSLPNRWDTHDASSMCDNHIYVKDYNSELKEYECLGHDSFAASVDSIERDLVYHGDPARNNHFWVYPEHRPLLNPQWDTYDARVLCGNHNYVKDYNHELKEYECLGHRPPSPSEQKKERKHVITNENEKEQNSNKSNCEGELN